MSVSVVVLIVNHGHLARPITGINSFIKSPNIQFTNPIALMSFIVYAIFAYGGMETTGGIVNQVNNPKKNYPRGIIIAAIIMTLTYSFSIFFVGVTTNWNKVLGNEKVNLGNITYVLVNNLGFVTAKTFGLSNGIAILFGDWFARFAGLSMFISYIGAFFVLIYSPLESFLEGTDKRIWPKKWSH